MTDIQYLAPTTLDEAVGAYAKAAGSARILAGGTDLLVQMGAGLVGRVLSSLLPPPCWLAWAR